VSGWSPLEAAVVGIFSAWFLFSIAAQVLPRESGIRQSRLGWLVPDWRFFAPEPAVEDRVLVYRFKDAADQVGALEVVELPRSGPLRWLWNPACRRHKALFDLTDGVLRLAGRLPREERETHFADPLVLTEPYLALLNLVSSSLDAPNRGLVQFGVVTRAWPEHDELVFLSRWHSVGDR
jgi:hypothetical protein